MLQQSLLGQFVVGQGVMSDGGLMNLLVSRICLLLVCLYLLLCPLVLFRKVRVAAFLAVEEVPREHCQRVLPVSVGNVVKHLCVKWLAFRRCLCMVLTELLQKRVKYRPSGLLVRWLVVRVELHDASEKRLVASLCRLPFVHAIERWDDRGIDAPAEEQIGDD